jgi:hypothetical protein
MFLGKLKNFFLLLTQIEIGEYSGVPVADYEPSEESFYVIEVEGDGEAPTERA